MVNTRFWIIIGIVFCTTSIILGAFGAHALKEILPPSSLTSFETGVRYQFYSGLAILIITLLANQFHIQSKKPLQLIGLGTCLFSFSIYFLSLKSVLPFGVSWLGPITPIGGLLMIIGWILLGMNSRILKN